MRKVVTSDMPGVFYCRVNPESPPLKGPGDKVAVGDQICLVEIMKSFLPVEAEEAGVFVEYRKSDGEMVESGDPLYAMEV